MVLDTSEPRLSDIISYTKSHLQNSGESLDSIGFMLNEHSKAHEYSFEEIK
jgi:hemerythrin